jgi:hypothetical protein
LKTNPLRILDSKEEKTIEGKNLIKMAIDAQNKGINLRLGPPDTKLLESINPSSKGKGEGFTMTDKADKNKIEIAKKLNTYTNAKESYTKNPTPTTLKRFQKAKIIVDELKNTGFVETKVEKPVIEAKTTTPLSLKSPEGVIGKASEGVVQPSIEQVKPKEVSVPREQLPVGKGEIKATALEARVKGTQDLVKGATPEQLEALGLEGTNTAHNDQQLADAAKYVADNQEEAIKVLTGEIPAPKGILRNAILSAMVDQGNKDTALGVKLSGLFSKRYGQEIQILSTINPNSPVKLLSELYKVNEARIQKRYGGKTVKEISTKLEGKMKDVAKKAKKYDWNDFISSIDTC